MSFLTSESTPLGVMMELSDEELAELEDELAADDASTLDELAVSDDALEESADADEPELLAGS